MVFLKLSEKPLELNNFLSSKRIVWLTEEDSSFYPMVGVLEEKRVIQTTKLGSYFNHFHKDILLPTDYSIRLRNYT